ncbi:Hypothetical predicted protein [Mytilus galloprovincialis]|uniref:Uncharacterized protein n=1 Tax=Mytilus galloprovincialis TaxID=29158 RepID=A0A8B6G2W0_MYTGA|nr:Hypothetical predicted protein [Mytilus galloprovincialis]
MALNTKSLIEESKKAMEQSDNDSNMNKILMILERIDMRQQKLEDKLSKIDEMSDSLSQICNKITEIETSILNLVKRNSLIEKSVEDIGGLLDTVVERCTSNKKEIENMKRRNTEIERQIENDNLKENFKQIEQRLLDLSTEEEQNIASEYRGALLKNNQKQSGASPPVPPRPFKRTRTQSSDTNYEENEYV